MTDDLGIRVDERGRKRYGPYFVRENPKLVVGLYSQAIDSLTVGSTIDDVTTEPNGKSYSRLHMPDTSSTELQFDVSDSTNKVDCVFAWNPGNGELSAEWLPTPGTYDLDGRTTLPVSLDWEHYREDIL